MSSEPVDIARLREEYAKAMRFPKDTCTSPVPLHVVDVGELAVEVFPALLDELEDLRAKVAAFPTMEIKWAKDNPCGYPHVDIRHNGHYGMRAVGWVVPDGLEDRLPSMFDGIQMWSNPLPAGEDNDRV